MLVPTKLTDIIVPDHASAGQVSKLKAPFKIMYRIGKHVFDASSAVALAGQPTVSMTDSDILSEMWQKTLGPTALGKMAPMIMLGMQVVVVEKPKDRRDYDSDSDDDDSNDSSAEEAQKDGLDPKAIVYQPSYGDIDFTWGGNSLILRREPPTFAPKDDGKPVDTTNPNAPSNLKISCWSWRGSPLPKLKAFLDSPSRPLENVALDKAVKDPLVQDASLFVTVAQKTFYANRGIPYRRGYLFYGPPCIGKTSTALALAGHLRVPLFIISMSDPDLSDRTIEILSKGMSCGRSIFLLEDIDRSSLDRDKHRKPAKKSKRSGSETDQPVQSGLTLSGLLNVLDGASSSSEGRIVIMSANDPGSLDPALIREGRIDQKILFGYASHEVCANLYRHMFTATLEELQADQTDPHAHLDIAKLSEDFASLVPRDIITPAEVQGHLMTHRFSPEDAITHAKKHFETKAETKRLGKNVAAFAKEISKKDKEALNSKDAEAVPAAMSISSAVSRSSTASKTTTDDVLAARTASSTRSSVSLQENTAEGRTASARASISAMPGVTLLSEHTSTGASRRRSRSSRAASVALSPTSCLPSRRNSSVVADWAARVGSAHSDGVRVEQLKVSRAEKTWLNIVMN